MNPFIKAFADSLQQAIDEVSDARKAAADADSGETDPKTGEGTTPATDNPDGTGG